MTTPAQTSQFAGWTIDIVRHLSAEMLGDTTGYTDEQIDRFLDAYDDECKAMVATAFPGAEITWMAGGWTEVNAITPDGEDILNRIQVEEITHNILDAVFDHGQWSKAVE